MEEIQKALENYEWLSDSQFMSGLTSINQKSDRLGLDPQAKKALIEDAKLFYFQRNVKQFDIGQFKAWKESQSEEQRTKLFQDFESFDFDSDVKYQAGLQTVVRELVSKGFTGSQFSQEIDKLKLFYFSKLRNAPPPEYAAFVAWKANRRAEEVKKAAPVCPYGYSAQKAPEVSTKAPHAQPPAQVAPKVADLDSAGATCPFGYTAASLEQSADATSRPASVSCVEIKHFSKILTQITVHYDALKALAAGATNEEHTSAFLEAAGKITTTLWDLLSEESKVNAVLLSTSGDDANQASCVVGDLPASWLPSRDDLGALAFSLHQALWTHGALMKLSAGTPVMTLADGGSLPLPLFLTGSLRFVTHRTAIRFPRALVGVDKRVLDLVSKASSPGVARYLALTRKKIFASDILYSGLATHFLPASKVPTLLMIAGRAAACPPPHTLQAISSSLGALVDYAGPSRLQTFQADIDRIFSNIDSIDSLLESLKNESSSWAGDALTLLKEIPRVELELALNLLKKLDSSLNDASVGALHLRLGVKLAAAQAKEPDFATGDREIFFEQLAVEEKLPSLTDFARVYPSSAVETVGTLPSSKILQLLH